MKKFFLSLSLMLPLCGFAQKGMQGVGFGVEGGWGTNPAEGHSLSSYGASLKYEYNLTDRLRLSANLNAMNAEGLKYYQPTIAENPNTPDRPYLLYPDEVVYEIKDAYTDVSASAATFNLDLHVFLNNVRRLRTYLSFGGIIGTSEDGSGDWWYIATGARAGLGFNWRMTYNWSLQLELPIKWMFTGYRYQGYYFNSKEMVVYYYEGVEGEPMSKSYGELERKDPDTKTYVSFNDYYTYLWVGRDGWEYGSRYARHYLTFTPQINIVYTF